jgi:hypothetical protein
MSDIGVDVSGVVGLLTLAVIDFGLLIATFVLLLRAVFVEQKPDAQPASWRARREFRQAVGASVSAVVSIAFTAGMGWMVSEVLSKPACARFDYMALIWLFAVIAVWWMTVRMASSTKQSHGRIAVQQRSRPVPERGKGEMRKEKRARR